MRTLFFQDEAEEPYGQPISHLTPAGAPYRLYVLDPLNGRIRSFHEIDARNDAAAVKSAKRSRSSGPMVLWSRQRKVRQWEGLPVKWRGVSA